MIKFAFGQTTARTTTGSQDLDASSQLGTMVPKAVIVMASLATSLDAVVDHGMFAMGIGSYYNSTYENRGTGSSTRHSQATSESYTYRGNDALIAWRNPTTSNLNAASLTSFSAGKATINWDTRDDNSAIQLAFLLIADDGQGDTVTARVGDIEPNENESGDVTITPGFESELIFWVGRGRADLLGSGANAAISFGAYNSSAQVGRAFWVEDDVSTSNAEEQLANNRIGMREQWNSGTNASFQVDTVTSTSFDVTTLDADASTFQTYFYLALNLSGLSTYVALVDSPTSTGNEDYTGPNFIPQAWIWAPTFRTAVGGANTGASFSLGLLADGGDAAFSISSEDAQGTTDEQSLASSAVLEHRQHTGAAGLKATFVAWLSTGARFNFSVVDASARKMIVIAIDSGITTYSDSITANAVIRQVESSSFTAAAVLLKEQPHSLSANAVILKGAADSFTIDSIILDEQTSLFYIDAFISGGVSPHYGDFTIDAYITKTEHSGGFFIDATIKATTETSFVIDAHIVYTEEGDFTANAVIEREEQYSFSAAAVIHRAEAGSFTIDAAIEETHEYFGSFTLNAYIADYYTFSINAVIVAGPPTFFGTNMLYLEWIDPVSEEAKRRAWYVLQENYGGGNRIRRQTFSRSLLTEELLTVGGKTHRSFTAILLVQSTSPGNVLEPPDDTPVAIGSLADLREAHEVHTLQVRSFEDDYYWEGKWLHKFELEPSFDLALKLIRVPIAIEEKLG